jgi:hypothetical protein
LCRNTRGVHADALREAELLVGRPDGTPFRPAEVEFIRAITLDVRFELLRRVVVVEGHDV